MLIKNVIINTLILSLCLSCNSEFTKDDRAQILNNMESNPIIFDKESLIIKKEGKLRKGSFFDCQPFSIKLIVKENCHSNLIEGHAVWALKFCQEEDQIDIKNIKNFVISDHKMGDTLDIIGYLFSLNSPNNKTILGSKTNTVFFPKSEIDNGNLVKENYCEAMNTYFNYGLSFLKLKDFELHPLFLKELRNKTLKSVDNLALVTKGLQILDSRISNYFESNETEVNFFAENKIHVFETLYAAYIYEQDSCEYFESN